MVEKDNAEALSDLVANYKKHVKTLLKQNQSRFKITENDEDEDDEFLPFNIGNLRERIKSIKEEMDSDMNKRLQFDALFNNPRGKAQKAFNQQNMEQHCSEEDEEEEEEDEKQASEPKRIRGTGRQTMASKQQTSRPAARRKATKCLELDFIDDFDDEVQDVKPVPSTRARGRPKKVSTVPSQRVQRKTLVEIDDEDEKKHGTLDKYFKRS